MSLATIYQLLLTAGTSASHFPPTLLYNEGWMLRLTLSWFQKSALQGHMLSFAEGANWFSEALLPTPFSPRHRGDSRAESRTHADGVLGHFRVGSDGKADVSLNGDASQFVVAEAKIFAPLSGGTKNAPSYGQAPRNVACMAEMLFRARRSPSAMTTVSFIVLAPASEIQQRKFQSQLDKESIRQSVVTRAKDYGDDLAPWLEEWFEPCLDRMTVSAVPWEEVISTIGERDPEAHDFMVEFYGRCLEFNALPMREKPA